MWPVLLVFPLSVIAGDLRYFDIKIAAFGLESWELMLYFLGLGWLILAFTPKNSIVSLLRISVLLSAILIPFQLFLSDGNLKLVLFLAFQFLNGICAACAFYLFCFVLNNVERLFGMSLIMFYYAFYYTIWREFPIIQEYGKTWGGAVVMAVYLVVVFSCTNLKTDTSRIETGSNGKGSGVLFVIGLDCIYYMIMCVINYIEYIEESLSNIAFGIGSLISVILVIIIHLWKGRNAMYTWLLFLTLSLLGLGALLYDSKTTFYSGSFAYGLGGGFGYIIIYYLCAGAIKMSKSLRMFRFYCFIFFIQYCVISGIYSLMFNYIDMPNKYIAFGIILVLGSACFMLIPFIQKKLFEADWTDGLYLKDMEQYSKEYAETEARNVRDNLILTVREEEILTLLLRGMAPKDIAITLKISYDTIRFHQKNLYRKLRIKSIQELFSRYAVFPGGKVV